MSKTFKIAAMVGAALVLATGAANATPVPAGALSIFYEGLPTVALTNNTITLGGPLGYSGGTGLFNGYLNFTGANTTTDTAPFTFAPSLGGLADYSGSAAVTPFLSFLGSDGDTYTFSLDQSIQTTNYQVGGSSQTIGLYLLGDMTALGPTPFSDPTPTALTFTFNQTGNSPWSASATLSNPPPGSGISTPAPEPASMFLMGTGLAAMGLIRRRRAKQ